MFHIGKIFCMFLPYTFKCSYQVSANSKFLKIFKSKNFVFDLPTLIRIVIFASFNEPHGLALGLLYLEKHITLILVKQFAIKFCPKIVLKNQILPG